MGTRPARAGLRRGGEGWGTLRVLVVGAWVVSAGVMPLRSASPPANFLPLMNVGKAELENRNSAKALEAFTAALALQPRSPQALRNLARAHMLSGQPEEALKPLERARSLEKESAATAYLIGLVHARQARYEQALPLFAEAVRLDPATAALRFQLANAFQMTKANDQAVTQFRETLRLDPLHAAAQFKLAALARQAGDQAEFTRHYEEFLRLRRLFGDEVRTPTALERCQYTRPEAAPVEQPPTSPALPVRFTEVSDQALPDAPARAAAAAVLEVDEQGRPVLFTTDDQGSAWLLAMDGGRRFQPHPVEVTLPSNARFQHGVAGNFYDAVPPGQKYDPALHARNDMLLLGTNALCLLQQTGLGRFEDVTGLAGLEGLTARSGAWVDYDHDGDVDLLLGGSGGLQLWQNNGDRRFTNVTHLAGLTNAIEVQDVAVADLDRDVAMDLVVAGAAPSTLVFRNLRAGRFAPWPEPPGPWPAAQRVLADDVDNDGFPDTLLVAADHGLLLSGRGTRRRFEVPACEVVAAALVDYDNDGWLDLCLGGRRRDDPDRGALQLWRNQSGAVWTNVTTQTGLNAVELAPARELFAADLDADGDSDLLVLTSSGRWHVLRNDGGHVHRQLKLRLLGSKTNPAGLGTQVEVRAGPFWVTRQVHGPPIEIGLGERRRLDSVKTIWTNGIEDNQIDVIPPDRPLTIVEKNVAAGSCPYLYAWNGAGFRFVTDLLGNSPLGLSVRRDVVLPSDPEEIVWIGSGSEFRPHAGYYELEVTEELREVLYLDQAALWIVDHDASLEVHPTDKLQPPPFPASETWALDACRLPAQVLGSDGIDRTRATQAVDGDFAPPGLPLPPPLRGMCQPLALTLDFGPLDPVRPLVLALTGWLQYGDASVNIALSQNASAQIIPPQLEAEDSTGQWHPLPVVVGLPAGKTKTILCDLTNHLPPRVRRLRLTTTFEVRWDRLALFERATNAPLQRIERLPATAELYWRGFSDIRPRAPGHPATPDYESVTPRPPWRTTPQGWCTRYGEVRELVAARDDRLVLLNGGDALRLRFAADDLPPVAPGQTRSFFFYAVGWDKDADYNVVDGDEVEPLPVQAAGPWRETYNTRWVPAGKFQATAGPPAESEP